MNYVLIFHTLILPYWDDATRVPLLFIHINSNGNPKLLKHIIGDPISSFDNISQTLIVKSKLPDIILVSSLLNNIKFTVSVCPTNGSQYCLYNLVSHICIVLSFPPDASNDPSLLNDVEYTHFV